MVNVKEMAEVYRIGLQIGIFSKADIINWADQTIEKLDYPSNEIIEVSLSSNDKLVDIASKLKNIKGRYDKKLPLKIILGLLWEKFIVCEENVLEIKFFISSLVQYDCCEELDDVHTKLYNFNEEIYLATENIYGNLENISQEIKEFLSIYKDFSKCFR
ncbi:hypothetical protein [Bacillus sp. XF8]|uniref:hypothetical protein n=1 Tax=Bacillus sp. XF8 TaxID=2819289 RepID=UPI001AA02B60|nr:hypothetical protein [Bacillus sp. XF8]MBO1581659.1 hypothetical protein [Bacillus sp. XF8]